jgi:signal transduction histidine kinase
VKTQNVHDQATMINELQARAIANLGASLSTSLNVQQHSALSLQSLQAVTGAAFVAIHLNSLGFPGFDAEWVGNVTPRQKIALLEGSLVEQAAANRAFVHWELSGDEKADFHLSHLVVWPIVVQDRVIGSTTLGWESALPANFDGETIQRLVDTCGLALETARVYEAQQHYIQALEYLGSLSMELNLLPDAVQVIDRVNRITEVLLSAERCAIFLTLGNQVEDVHTGGLPGTFGDALIGADMSVWSVLANAGMNAYRALTIGASEIAAAGRVWQEMFQVENIQSGMMVPLRGHARVLGWIAIYYTRPYIPSVFELRLLEILAAQIAVALDNIELNEANEQHAATLAQRVAERTQELAIALDKAEDADRLKTQLLSTVSHELRTPLAVIKAHATTTLSYYDKLSKERHIHYMTTINEEADRLTKLINSLLDMSRLEAGRLEIKLAHVEPLPLLNELREAMQTRYMERPFHWELPASLSPILADGERVRQVIENLVDNADKYSPADTPIEVGARVWEDALEIWVKDQGSGLTPEQTRRVFERFYQIDGSATTARAGVGLGLAICKGLIEEMGGRIWCESTLGNGSKFAFTLPWAGEKTSQIASKTATPG